MAQSAVTVRIDSEMKSKFDKLCEQFGMSANTAFNIFVNAVVRSRSIPFTIKGDKVGTPSALDLFMKFIINFHNTHTIFAFFFAFLRFF